MKRFLDNLKSSLNCFWQGAQINAYDMYGETPVYTAASHGHLKVLKTLCNYGADVREGVVKNCLFSTLKELAQSN